MRTFCVIDSHCGLSRLNHPLSCIDQFELRSHYIKNAGQIVWNNSLQLLVPRLKQHPIEHFLFSQSSSSMKKCKFQVWLDIWNFESSFTQYLFTRKVCVFYGWSCNPLADDAWLFCRNIFYPSHLLFRHSLPHFARKNGPCLWKHSKMFPP